MTDLFNTFADICGHTGTSVLPTPQPPKHPVLDYYPFVAPKHLGDADPGTDHDPISHASAWYAMTGPLHCAGDRCRVGWSHTASCSEVAS